MKYNEKSITQTGQKVVSQDKILDKHNDRNNPSGNGFKKHMTGRRKNHATLVAAFWEDWGQGARKK